VKASIGYQSQVSCRDQRHDLTVREQILWESETATHAEVYAIEIKFIRETGANNPAIGYNLSPRWIE
jgi:hypothetical protein